MEAEGGWKGRMEGKVDDRAEGKVDDGEADKALRLEDDTEWKGNEGEAEGLHRGLWVPLVPWLHRPTQQRKVPRPKSSEGSKARQWPPQGHHWQQVLPLLSPLWILRREW